VSAEAKMTWLLRHDARTKKENELALLEAEFAFLVGNEGSESLDPYLALALIFTLL
jgi:hypothetical protein